MLELNYMKSRLKSQNKKVVVIVIVVVLVTLSRSPENYILQFFLFEHFSLPKYQEEYKRKKK